MKKLLLSVCLLAAASLTALADTITQTITVNGSEVTGKQVTAIAFAGNEATLTYSDQTTETAPIEQVNILLSYTPSPDDPTAIGKVSVFEFGGIVDGQLQLGGLEAGTPVQVVDITGKTYVSTRATEGLTTIDCSAMQRGVYVVRAGQQVVKFMKK